MSARLLHGTDGRKRHHQIDSPVGMCCFERISHAPLHTFSTAATFIMVDVLATFTDLVCLATVLQLAAGALAAKAIAKLRFQSLQRH